MNEWISVEDELPGLEVDVLLLWDDFHIENGKFYDDGDGPYYVLFDGDTLISEPTHWMPLPSPPKESE